MNIAYSILSAAATVESAVGTAEAASAGKWEYILNPVQSAGTVETGTESAGVIDRLQALDSASQQITDPDYWGSVGIIALTGILIVFFILIVLIFMFWLLGVTFKAVDKKKKAKADAAKAAAPAPAAPAPAPAEEIEEVDSDDEIMAVISAAIAAYAEEEGASYTIRNVKRRDSRTRSAWSLAGIGENTRPF